METKVCSKCKRELTIDNFVKKKDGKNGLRAECKDCCKQYQQENKVAIAEYQKQWRGEHLEIFAEYYKQYYQDNKEVLAEKAKQYFQEHLEEYRVRWQRREAKKRLLPSTLTIQQWESIKEHFNNSCAYCGKELPLAQEHLIPLSKSGEYAISNIICACQGCNSSKGDRDFFKWYPKQLYYSKEREKKISEYLGYSENGIQQLSIL